MNKYERKQQFQLDMIAEMLKYALTVNSNTETKEYQDALFNWSEKFFDDFKTNWENQNGKLEG